MNKDKNEALDYFFNQLLGRFSFTTVAKNSIAKILADTKKLYSEKSANDEHLKMIDEIDTDLSLLEDQYHGEFGDALTNLRVKINNYLKSNGQEK